MEHQLNSRQEEAYKMFIDFLDSSSMHDTFVLTGFAGTGKTFLLKCFVNYLSQNLKDGYFGSQFELLATTGRAASNLGEKANKKARTIHSAIYTFKRLTDAINVFNDPYKHHDQLELRFEMNVNSPSVKIIIIDEVSMLGNEQDSRQLAVNFGTGRTLDDLLSVYGNSKIIFVGDPAQLPPINVDSENSLPPALDPALLTRLDRKVISFSLTEIMRQKADNDILDVATEIRNYIQEGTRDQEKFWPTINVFGKKNCSVYSSQQEMLESYMALKAKNTRQVIGLASTNDMLRSLNLKYRELNIGNAKAPLRVGESMLVYQNNSLYAVSNGDFIEIINIEKEHQHCSIKFMYVRIKNVSNETETSALMYYDGIFSNSVNFTREQRQYLFKDFIIRMKTRDIIPDTDAFNEALRVDPFLNALICGFGYFVTAHKAQGGEWDDVFIFEEKGLFSSGFSKYISRLKWWYTAVTRAKKNLHLISNYSLR